MSSHPTTLRRRLRRGAAVTAGLATLGGSLLLSFPAPANAAGATVTIKVEHSKTWGNLLELGNGKTVYRLDSDPKDKSTCNGKCAKVWPPVVLTGSEKAVGKGVKGVGTIRRSDGQRQVTYKGVPLYTFIADHKAGQINGNIKDSFGQWGTVNPAHPLAKPVKISSGSSTSPTTKASGSSGAAF